VISFLNLKEGENFYSYEYFVEHKKSFSHKVIVDFRAKIGRNTYIHSYRQIIINKMLIEKQVICLNSTRFSATVNKRCDSFIKKI
jgi:hypothetical protein